MTATDGAKRILASPAELHTLAGTSLGTTPWRVVQQAQIDAFAGATGDHQWIHVDPERAAQGPFGTTIAHGMLTLSLVPLLATELIEVPSARLVVNCGFDRVRFLQPVPVDARVRGRTTLVKAVDVPDGVRATFDVEVQIEGAERPACVATIVLQWAA